MKGHTKIIKVDGEVIEQDWTSMPDLKFWQDAVGGWIEQIPHWPDGVAFCNEEGKLNDLPFNEHATNIWRSDYDVLMGDVVQATGDNEFMEKL